MIGEIKQSALLTIELEAQSIAGLKSSIDDGFQKVVETIHASIGRVVVTGIGKSAIVGQKIVATLKPKFRLPILLKYVEGLSYDEIAKVLDCSIGTVSSRLNRGHKLLAQKLGHLKDEI